jgi:Cu(I)/Ag(I) efflux system membrane fusion protein
MTTPRKTSALRRALTVRRFLIFAGLVLGLVLIGQCVGDSTPTTTSAGGERPVDAAADVVWTCSMHPQVRQSGPGRCPLCGMDLVPVKQGPADETGSRRLSLDEAAVALADIRTARVERRHVAHEVRLVGKVVPDETRLAYLTAWVPGRLERVFVDYTGLTVRQGDHLVEIYSPQLYAAQEELLQAVLAERRLQDNALATLREGATGMLRAARDRLRLWGLTEAQIDATIAQGSVDERVVLYAPIGGVVLERNALEGQYVETGTRIYTIADLTSVWVVFDAYESDLSWLRYGQDVAFRAQALPGETFHGRVAFIDPVLDDRTRTVKVRVNVANADLRLKPEMFVRGTVQAVLTPHGRSVDASLAGKWMCPMHPEVVADAAGDCPLCGMALATVEALGFVADGVDEPPLVVPATAPLITGKRAVVYVRLADTERPTFEGREVELGPRGGDWYVVHSGLAEGDEVVVHGAFKLDSELQIRARPSMMSPEGAPPPAHEHGGH